jgi:DNA-binding transcriptional ArsR family regulator
MNEKCCQIFFALGESNRIKILELLKNEELCVSDICKRFDITQPSVSHHLDILKRSGLVKSEKRGREVYYSFNRDAIIDCCGQQFKAFALKIVKG